MHYTLLIFLVVFVTTISSHPPGYIHGGEYALEVIHPERKHHELAVSTHKYINCFGHDERKQYPVFFEELRERYYFDIQPVHHLPKAFEHFNYEMNACSPIFTIKYNGASLYKKYPPTSIFWWFPFSTFKFSRYVPDRKIWLFQLICLEHPGKYHIQVVGTLKSGIVCKPLFLKTHGHHLAVGKKPALWKLEKKHEPCKEIDYENKFIEEIINEEKEIINEEKEIIESKDEIPHKKHHKKHHRKHKHKKHHKHKIYHKHEDFSDSHHSS